MAQQIKPLVLVILDGWGYREEADYNAIAQANIPTWNKLWSSCPHGLIQGSGHCVGLPDGQMGNSEVGHLNLGAGRLVPQEFTRINDEIQMGSFFANPTLMQALTKAKQSGNAVHILGLLSPGGVHSHENHIQAMVKMAALSQIENVYLHAFLDGRDTPPKSALNSIVSMEAFFKQLRVGQFASVIGRYYAMDRDNRWERTQAAYDLISQGNATYTATSAHQALENAYARGETDEFVMGTSIHAANASPIQIQDNDVVIFMNFRADRARALTRVFTEGDFKAFPRTYHPHFASFVTLTEYAKDLPVQVAYPPLSTKNGLGEYLASLHKRQLRIAETEKYAHVTFFFNGGRESPFPGEDRELIPSPKVATYDLQPEMSALTLTESLVTAIKNGQYDVIICNYANPDMVGHTGNFAATVKAIEIIDHCLNQVLTALRETGGEMLITADHGNAEYMYDEKTRQAHTAHTCEPVPIIYTGQNTEFVGKNGTLSDVAPSILYLLGLDKPNEMTGCSLFE